MIDWIPYSYKDHIIFEGNDSILDTMFIIGVQNEMVVRENPKNDLNSYQYIAVNAKIPDRWTSFDHKKYRKSTHTILHVAAYKNYTSVEINFRPFQYFLCRSIPAFLKYSKNPIGSSKQNMGPTMMYT